MNITKKFKNLILKFLMKKKVIKNPYLSNINQDSTMSGMINRELNPGSNLVGKETPEFRPTIPVKGAGLASKHCTIEYN